MAAVASDSIRSVLVHLDGTPACAARLALAKRQAQRTGATLWAMFVAGSTQRPLKLAVSESPAALLETEDWAALARARALFEDAGGRDEASMRWLDALGTDAMAAFHRDALVADLLVLGQPDPEAPAGAAAPAAFVETVLVETGRPALVVPRELAPDAVFGRDVLVGWNATPSSARAITAAMPWLRRARGVHVLQGAQDEDDDDASGPGVATWLRSHGVAIELHEDRRTGDAGQALLALARETSADLLVMGAFGHGRTRERILGGTSRTVLESMTLPVLMTH